MKKILTLVILLFIASVSYSQVIGKTKQEVITHLTNTGDEVISKYDVDLGWYLFTQTEDMCAYFLFVENICVSVTFVPITTGGYQGLYKYFDDTGLRLTDTSWRLYRESKTLVVNLNTETEYVMFVMTEL